MWEKASRKIKPRKHSLVHTWTQDVNVFVCVSECVCALNGNDYKMAPTTCRRRAVIVIVGIRWISYVSFAF